MLIPSPNYWYTESGGLIFLKHAQQVDPEESWQQISEHEYFYSFLVPF